MHRERKSNLPVLLIVLAVLLLPMILFGGQCAQGFKTGWNASHGIQRER